MTSEVMNLAMFANIPPRLAGIVAYRALCAGVSLRTLRSEDKRQELVEIRRRIAKEARADGYSLWQIGRALNRDKSTVRFHILSPRFTAQKVADAPMAEA